MRRDANEVYKHDGQAFIPLLPTDMAQFPDRRPPSPPLRRPLPPSPPQKLLSTHYQLQYIICVTHCCYHDVLEHAELGLQPTVRSPASAGHADACAPYGSPRPSNVPTQPDLAHDAVHGRDIRPVPALYVGVTPYFSLLLCNAFGGDLLTDRRCPADGLMTPPDSPDKQARGRMTDFHPMLDARGPPLAFDIRHGTHLSGEAAKQPAINHHASRLLVNIGPNVLTIEIVASTSAGPTLGDVFGQLASALRMRAHSAEVANAVQLGVAAPHSVVPNISRAGIMNVKFIFAGFTLRALQNGVAYVDCHLRCAM